MAKSKKSEQPENPVESVEAKIDPLIGRFPKGSPNQGVPVGYSKKVKNAGFAKSEKACFFGAQRRRKSTLELISFRSGEADWQTY